MTYSQAFKYGNLVLPSTLLFHYHELFDQADDYLVWQFFFLQNTTGQETLTPNQIASRPRIGVTCTDTWLEEPLGFYVAGNRHVSKMPKRGLLDDEDTWKKE